MTKAISHDDDRDRIVFDLETQKDFNEVGGRNNLHLLKISVLGFFSFKDNEYFVCEEGQLSKFIDRLKRCPTLIGFNIKHFDLPVLKPYVDFDLDKISRIDLMDDVIGHLGFRLSLDSIAYGTLNKNKSAEGIKAIKWFKSGQMDKIKRYCLDDVKITKEIYDFALQNGYIKAFSRNNLDIIKIPISFGNNKALLNGDERIAEAFNFKKRLKIKYWSNENNKPDELVIEIYKIKGSFLEAFDPAAKKIRLLRIDKINQHKILNETYDIPENYSPKI